MPSRGPQYFYFISSKPDRWECLKTDDLGYGLGWAERRGMVRVGLRKYRKYLKAFRENSPSPIMRQRGEIYFLP